VDFPHDDPLSAWASWFAEAEAHEPDVPNAMQLATVGPEGAPRLRTVLLKGVDEAGLVFYTNLGSRKGRDLNENPRVAVTFHWKSLERQVHVEGRVRPVLPDEADAYFATRNRGSQVGAWASDQSRPVESRAALLEAVARHEARFEGREVPRPPYWSGFRIVPDRWEFWQGLPDRLHDRFEFLPEGSGWSRRRLQP
jgi:pyridoxamine 5'-phosphate oxidase